MQLLKNISSENPWLTQTEVLLSYFILFYRHVSSSSPSSAFHLKRLVIYVAARRPAQAAELRFVLVFSSPWNMRCSSLRWGASQQRLVVCYCDEKWVCAEDWCLRGTSVSAAVLICCQFNDLINKVTIKNLKQIVQMHINNNIMCLRPETIWGTCTD